MLLYSVQMSAKSDVFVFFSVHIAPTPYFLKSVEILEYVRALFHYELTHF